MNTPSHSISKISHSVFAGAERLYDTLTKEWQAAQSDMLDRAHGATLEDRPSAGYHPCDAAELSEPAMPKRRAAPNHSIGF